MGAHRQKNPNRRGGILGLIIMLLGFGLVTMGASPALATGNGSSQLEPAKAAVCKYVGKPGVDERLQTGNNPIVVDRKDWMVKGSYFQDGQDRSYVLDFLNPGDPEPDVSQCPAPDGPPDPPKPTVVKVSVTLDGKCDVNNDDVSPSTSDDYTSGEPVWNDSKVSVTFTMNDGVNKVFKNGKKTITVTKSEVNTEPCVEEPTPVGANAPIQTAVKCVYDTVVLAKQDEGVELKSDTGWVDNGDGTATRTIEYQATKGYVAEGQFKFVLTDSSAKCEQTEPETVTPCLSFGAFPAGSVWYAQVSRTGSEDILDGPFPLTKTDYVVTTKNLYGVVFYVFDKPGGTQLAVSKQYTKDELIEFNQCIALNPKDPDPKPDPDPDPKPEPKPTVTPPTTGGGTTPKPGVKPVTSSTTKPAAKPSATVSDVKRGIGANTGIEAAASVAPMPVNGSANWLAIGLGAIAMAIGLSMLQRRAAGVRS